MFTLLRKDICYTLKCWSDSVMLRQLGPKDWCCRFWFVVCFPLPAPFSTGFLITVFQESCLSSFICLNLSSFPPLRWRFRQCYSNIKCKWIKKCFAIWFLFTYYTIKGFCCGYLSVIYEHKLVGQRWRLILINSRVFLYIM